MSLMLKRMFAYFTVLSYLIVGTIAIRVCMPEMRTIEVSQNYFKLFSNTEETATTPQVITVPVMKFAKISLPSDKKPVVRVATVKKTIAKAAPKFKLGVPKLKGAFKLLPPPKLKSASQVVSINFENPTKNELPFNEPVTLSPVVAKTELSTNVVSLYREFKYEMVAKVERVIEDTISTQSAAAAKVADAPAPEPEFFEYPEVKEEKKPVEEVDALAGAALPVQEEIVPQTIVEEKVVTNNKVSDEDLVAFDYSKAQADVVNQVIPQVSAVTTQVVQQGTSTPKVELPKVEPTAPRKPQATTPVQSGQEALTTQGDEKANGFLPQNETTSNRLTIQVTGTDLHTNKTETGFELRFADDQSEILQDYNTGSIVIEDTLAATKMTRAAVVLKRGYAPTNTDLILEENSPEVSIPLIEENKFNELLAPYESRGPIGAVLVDLEDGVETAILDVPYSQVIKLDEDMRITDDKFFSYQLFVGVKAGNALLGYKDSNGDVTTKVIHIHEHELTFDANIFEDVESEKIVLKEEDLLSKEKAPLIISSEQVRHFASDKVVSKVNDHTYRTEFNKTLLGSRKYLELTHQEESIFVGYKDAKSLNIPSEGFMRYLLSRFEDSKLGERCMVQVNLPKKAVDVKVGAESAGESLMTYTQVLDTNGKFFDSVSKKSRMVLVVGENQGSAEYSKDSKINIKITFEDGSVQYLGSYCSPNTYLIEQL